MLSINKKTVFTAIFLTGLGLTQADAKEAHSKKSHFEPNFSVVLDGGYASTKSDPEDYSLAGFDGDFHGRVEGEGFYAGHNEVTASSHIDEKLYAQATVVLAEHDGDIEVELEEAFIETLVFGHNTSIKAGRMLPVFGYLNEHHLHEDFFVERPLAYQAFLGGHLIDDGIEISTILPKNTNIELGAGIFRGSNYPATSHEGVGLYKAHARIEGDFNKSTSWRLGAHYAHAEPEAREAGGHGHGHGHGGGDLEFTGDSDLYALEAKIDWKKKLELRGEYFIRKEDGFYDDGTDTPAFDGTASGLYTQATYKFHPDWTVGARYDLLMPEEDIDADLHGTALDAEGHEPSAGTVSLQYRYNDSSRVRASYANADLSADQPTDHRFFLNFQVTIGTPDMHDH